MSRRRLSVATLSMFTVIISITVSTPSVARAWGTAAACPGGTAEWGGTQQGPSAPVVVTGDGQITCSTPQVTITAGSTRHRQTSTTQPQNGQPCYEYEDSKVAIGPLSGGQRPISWYDPGRGSVWTQAWIHGVIATS